MKIKERLKRLETLMKKFNSYDEDNFITALGVNKEDFALPGGGYDFIAALNSTAKEAWENMEI